MGSAARFNNCRRSLATKGRVLAVAFSPDGRYVASGGLADLKVWDLATRRPRLDLAGHSEWIGAIAFSPDGRVIAAGGGEKTVHLWDAETGRPLRTLAGHTGAVNDLQFSPDGRSARIGESRRKHATFGSGHRP